MGTGDDIHVIKGRVVKIWHPDRLPQYVIDMLGSSAQNKYLIRIENPAMPANGWWRRIVFQGTKCFETWIEKDVLMQACPYSVGEVVELSVAKVLVPSGLYTTEG